jgi:hypothetical protein
MSYRTTTYKILIASPSDVTLAREVIPEVIYRWNRINSDYYKVSLLPVKWETDTAPEIGDSPQEIINRQLVKDCDILIGIFWTRIGTKTKKAESGTVEEITHFVKENKPAMIYFSSEPIDPNKINLKQKERLDEFKREIEKIALIESYESTDDLKEKIDRQLTKVIKDIFINPKSIVNKYSTENLSELKDSKKQEDKSNPLLNKSLLLLSNIENKLQPKTITENLFSDFLYSIYNNLAVLKPDISSYKDNFDEAIINQINSALPINYIFIKASLIASKSKNIDAIKTIYNYFGNLFKLCDVPEGFSGIHHEKHFEGYRFLLYEMFVSFIAALIKYDNWEIIGDVLSNDIFIEQKHSKYISYIHLNTFIHLLDVYRNSRLHLERASVVADLLKERFSNSDLSHLILHNKFLEADYFLFMRSICNEENTEDLLYSHSLWCPRSCIYLNWAPSYIVRAESKKYLEKLIKAVGLEKCEDFINIFKKNNSIFKKCFSNWIFSHNPLKHYDFNKIGTRE